MNGEQPWPAGGFEAAAELSMDAWRGVAAQQVVATLRLVDTLEEELLLEQMLQASQAPVHATSPSHDKPALLTQPFRVRSPAASRFRRTGAPGVWYGAQTLKAAAAEVAYWRRRFLIASRGLREQELLTEHTFFRARVAGPALDLLSPPWLALREQWTRDRDYVPTQALADAARARGLQWLRYESVRDPGTPCGAVLQVDALQALEAGSPQTWHCKTTQQHVMLVHGEQRHEWRFAA